MIADNATGATGANLERRGSMVQRFGGVKGHDINREMAVNRGPQEPAKGPVKPIAPPPNDIKSNHCNIF